MKKIITFLKDKKIYFFNTFIILFILFIVLFLKDLYPFSNTTIATSDAFIQYQPMLYNFLEKIRLGILENYTFNNGFGGATAFNYVYYISSPLNILSIIFKTPNSIFLSAVVIRTILTGIISLFYFKKKTNNNFLSLLCSLGYTFSGWFLAYYNFNIWLDVFMIFPLFHYGLEQLIENNKSKIYIFTLAYMLICNFYITFSVCIYTLIYYFYRTFIKKEKYIHKIKNFQLIMFSTIIACLLCALHLYMVYDSFIKIGILTKNIKNLFEINILDHLSAIFYGQYNFIINSKSTIFPNIGLNMIFMISFIYYFFNKKITLKEKIKSLIITIIIILITFSKTADYILHGFHIPIGFAYRYSFIISFLIFLTFIRNYQTFDYKISKKVYIINVFLLTILTFLFIKDIIKPTVFFCNLGFILSYTIFFIFYTNENKHYKYILLPLIILEIICAFSNRIIVADTPNYEIKDFKTYKYRVNQTHEILDVNTNLYTNENNISTFTTMGYKEYLTNAHLLDIFSDGHNSSTVNNPSTIFTMFFNTQTNKYYLEKIFAVNKEYKDLKLDNEIVTFNNMIEKSTGYKDVLIPQEPDIITKDKIIYNIKEDGNYRVNFTAKCLYSIVDTNDSTASNVIGINSLEVIAQTLNLKKGFAIIITEFKENSNPLNLYKEDEFVLEKAYNKLSKNQINYSYYSDSHMEGTITVDKDQIIYTSIPYDKDWIITIDGKKVEPYKITNSFIGFDCEEGTHDITLTYKTHYTIPTIISITTFIALIVDSIIKKKQKKDTNLA